MIRRQPTTISLSPEDLVELEEELEEFKLQREIKAQQRNLQRSATVVAGSDRVGSHIGNGNGDTQGSPLQKPSQQSNSQRPLSQTVNAGSGGARNNPFFAE